MAHFYSNMKLTKETPAPTILQTYITEEGTFTIKDVTTESYHEMQKLNRHIKFIKKDNEYIVELHPFKNDGIVLGLFIYEGKNFRVDNIGGKSPVFLYKYNNIQMDLKKFFNSNNNVKEIVVGLFLEGTKICYNINNKNICSILTKDGWTNINNTISSVIEAKNNTTEAKIELATQLLEAKEISESLYIRYLASKKMKLENMKDAHMNLIHANEIKLLKEKGL